MYLASIGAVSIINLSSDPLEPVLRDEIEKLAARYPRYGYRRITQMLLRMG